MIKLTSEYLSFQLAKELRSCYFLVGNDSFLLQESEQIVLEAAQKKGFQEHYCATSDNNHQRWQDIILNFKTHSLFATKRTFCLKFPPSYEKAVSILWQERLLMLAKLLQSNSNIILIIILSYLNKKQEESTWFTTFSTQNTVLVSCFTPHKDRYLKWINHRATKMGLKIEEDALQLLCCNYEGNLLSLVQKLNMLRLLWPDGRLSLSRVANIVSDVSYFTPSQWLDSVLSGQSLRALHILHQLRQQGSEINFLCNFLSYDLITLLTLQQHSLKSSSYPLLPNNHPHPRNKKSIRLTFLTDALKRLNNTHIKVAITLLSRLEIAIKNNENQTLLWSRLETISLLLSTN
ncbi:MAG: DNA polymerase III subunit delta [Candidatus Dasytiphilus stammeri]